LIIICWWSAIFSDSLCSGSGPGTRLTQKKFIFLQTQVLVSLAFSDENLFLNNSSFLNLIQSVNESFFHIRYCEIVPQLRTSFMNETKRYETQSLMKHCALKIAVSNKLAYFLSSPGANRKGWTQTLDFDIMRQVLYHSATTSNHSNFLFLLFSISHFK
jgi:hypothetical protein